MNQAKWVNLQHNILNRLNNRNETLHFYQSLEYSNHKENNITTGPQESHAKGIMIGTELFRLMIFFFFSGIIIIFG